MICELPVGSAMTSGVPRLAAPTTFWPALTMLTSTRMPSVSSRCSSLTPLYRSDVAYFERLHWQAMVDRTPEELAQLAGSRFRG